MSDSNGNEMDTKGKMMVGGHKQIESSSLNKQKDHTEKLKEVFSFNSKNVFNHAHY